MTTSPPQAPPLTPAGVVAAARESVAGLTRLVWAAKPAAELLDTVTELERLRSVLTAVQAEVAVEVDATDAAKSLDWVSTPDYLTSVIGARKGAGRRLLRTGRAITGEREATRVALQAGDISPEHAEVILRAVDHLPVDPDVRDRGEAFLIDQAAYLDATDLAKAADRLMEVVDPDRVHAHDELDPQGCDADGRDPRDHGARCWDALVQVAATALDARVLPESHGIRPRVIVTLDHHHLRTGLGKGTLDTGDTLSAAAVRKLACDAEVIPAVLGTRSELLDIGRTQRLVTTTLWTALVLRDRHCTFPGCRRPPIACDAHHITHWVNHGPTALHNLVLLCRAHHTHLHTSGWAIRINRHDQQPEFQPPAGRHPPSHTTWIRQPTPRE